MKTTYKWCFVIGFHVCMFICAVFFSHIFNCSVLTLEHVSLFQPIFFPLHTYINKYLWNNVGYFMILYVITTCRLCFSFCLNRVAFSILPYGFQKLCSFYRHKYVTYILHMRYKCRMESTFIQYRIPFWNVYLKIMVYLWSIKIYHCACDSFASWWSNSPKEGSTMITVFGFMNYSSNKQLKDCSYTYYTLRKQCFVSAPNRAKPCPLCALFQGCAYINSHLHHVYDETNFKIV